MDALTTPTHRDTLRVAALAGHDGVTAGSLSAELKATRAHMLNVFNELETQGFVRGTPAKGRRRPGVSNPARQGQFGARRVASLGDGRRHACRARAQDYRERGRGPVMMPMIRLLLFAACAPLALALNRRYRGHPRGRRQAPQKAGQTRTPPRGAPRRRPPRILIWLPTVLLVAVGGTPSLTAACGSTCQWHELR